MNLRSTPSHQRRKQQDPRRPDINRLLSLTNDQLAAEMTMDGISDDAEELDKNKSEGFHSTTAKLLYIMQRARPDIETSVSFLMKRVS